MKLLSVIIPLYNSAKWLPKCLDSVLHQDMGEEQLEIICVNDGSSDHSADIVRDYQTEHPQSVVLLEQENQGPSGARNNGMRNASGKYLCFVDPDDFVEPDVFGGLLNQMEAQQLDMLRFNYQLVDEEYQPVQKQDFEQGFDYSPCLMTGADFLADRLDIACNIWRYIYRTDMIVQNRIWCFTGDYFDDTPWLPMVLLQAKRMNVCDTVVYNYQQRGGSLVKAGNLQAVRRKNDGSLLLIQLLKEEMRVIRGAEANHANMEALANVKLDASVCDKMLAWYRMMITHTSLSLLTDTAVSDPKSMKSNLQRLREWDVFPLSQYKASTEKKRKIRLFNRFPLAMMRLLWLKSKI
jgi:glycosyltransferase involved in cell wall biosynthesis